jgi:AcrR family transcriptional regulator
VGSITLQNWTRGSRKLYPEGMSPTAKLTSKGAATRGRIVEAAADLILARGVGGTNLDDICAGTATSKGQVFHYFPGGKSDLVSAIASLQAERVLEAQRPFLDTLDTWDDWERWRDAVLAHYRSQPHWGCPIGALTAELIRNEPDRATELAAHMERWRGYLEAGLQRMCDSGQLQPHANPRRLALSTFAALQGGLLLTQVMESIEPLEAALDGALTALRDSATTSPS